MNDALIRIANEISEWKGENAFRHSQEYVDKFGSENSPEWVNIMANANPEFLHSAIETAQDSLLYDLADFQG